jgi:hypothetical protein
MDSNYVEMSVKGRPIRIPSIKVGDRLVVVSGGWPSIAEVKEEEWLIGEAVDNPERYIEMILNSKLNADIFTFSQKLPNTKPRYRYYMEWDNVAAISTCNYAYWWENKLPQETRKNVRRAGKRGIVVHNIPFSDELIKSIVRINNETPVRQGRPFWHYGKDVDVVKKDYSTFRDRSEYIGAFFESELVGFVKMVYMDDIAAILQVLCMNKHQDKRPANALLARAVEICNEKRLQYLVYGKYIYGKNMDNPLTEFKRRNGFEQVLLPRYYLPLNVKGKVAIRMGLHHGVKALLPGSFLSWAKQLRAAWYKNRFGAESSMRG